MKALLLSLLRLLSRNIIHISRKISDLGLKFTQKIANANNFSNYFTKVIIFAFFNIFFANAAEVGFKFPDEAFQLEVKKNTKCSPQESQNCQFILKIHKLKTTFKNEICGSDNECLNLPNILTNYPDKYELYDNYILFDKVDLKMLATNYNKNKYQYIYSKACHENNKKLYCLDFADKNSEKNLLCYYNYNQIFNDNPDHNISKYCFQNFSIKQKNSLFQPYEIDKSFASEIERLYIKLYNRKGTHNPNIKTAFSKVEAFKQMLLIADEIGLYLWLDSDKYNYKFLKKTKKSDKSIYFYLKEKEISFNKIEITETTRDVIKSIPNTLLILSTKKLGEYFLENDKFLLRRAEKFDLTYNKRNMITFEKSRICVSAKEDNEDQIIACTDIEAPKLCPAIIMRDKQIYEIFNANTISKGLSSQFATFDKTPANVTTKGFCDYGDNLINSALGQPEMKCLKNGKWDFSSFKNSCIRQKCPAIYITEDPTSSNDENIILQGSNADGSYNNNYQPKKYGYAIWETSAVGKIKAKKCIAGYKPNYSLPEMFCGQYSKWNFNSLKNPCQRIVCLPSQGRNNFPKKNASTSLKRSIIGDTFAIAQSCSTPDYDMPTATNPDGEKIKPIAYCNHEGKWEFENLCTKSCENITKEGNDSKYRNDKVNYNQSANNDSLTTNPYGKSSQNTYPFAYEQNNGFSQWERAKDKIELVENTSSVHAVGNQTMLAKIKDKRFIGGLKRELEVKNVILPKCIENYTCTKTVPAPPPVFTITTPIFLTSMQDPTGVACDPGTIVVTNRTTTYNIESSIKYNANEHTGLCKNNKNYYNSSSLNPRRKCIPQANSFFKKSGLNSISYSKTKTGIKNETTCQPTLCCATMSCNHCKQSEIMDELKNEIENEERLNLPHKKWGKTENPCKDSCPKEKKTYLMNNRKEDINWPKTRIGKTISTNNEGTDSCRQTTADLFLNKDHNCYHIARQCTKDGWQESSLCNINALGVIDAKKSELYQKLPTINRTISAICAYNNQTLNISCNNNGPYITQNTIGYNHKQCLNPNYTVPTKPKDKIYKEVGSFTVKRATKEEYIFTCAEVCAIKFSGKINVSAYTNPQNYQQQLAQESPNWKCKIKDKFEQMVTGFYAGGENKIHKNTANENNIDQNHIGPYYQRLKISSIYFENENNISPLSSYKHYLKKNTDHEIQQKINYCYKAQ